MAKRITSKDVPCTVCGAQPGQPCRGSMRGRPVDSHTKRREAAKAAQEAGES